MDQPDNPPQNAEALALDPAAVAVIAPTVRQLPFKLVNLKSTTTTQTVNQNSLKAAAMSQTVAEKCTEAPSKDAMYCRSPADLIDIFSDIVDDLAGLAGLSSLVSPFTDADPQPEECIHGSILDFLKNDLEEFLVERTGCDFYCEPGTDCEKVGAGEPEVESPQPSTHEPLYTPTYSDKSIPAPPKKRRPKKSAAVPPKEEPKKGCCSGCTII